MFLFPFSRIFIKIQRLQQKVKHILKYFFKINKPLSYRTLIIWGSKYQNTWQQTQNIFLGEKCYTKTLFSNESDISEME
jgi:hypothetical protein